MALSSRKYFIYTIFLVSPITLSLYAQSSIEKPTTSIVSQSKWTTSYNQNNRSSDQGISKLDNSNQFIAELSTPKDSYAIVIDENCQTPECNEGAVKTAYFSVLAKDIIENYKYDFSETFIDILFFEDIDLARTRTI